MPFPDLPPERLPGSPGHMPDHELITDALEYVKQSGYRDDPDFPPLPDVPVLGQSGHVTAHDRILAVLEYVKANPPGMTWAQISNTPTGTYEGDDGHTYAYYTFATSGTCTVTTSGNLEIVVVGGGGGGLAPAGQALWYSHGGGGGVRWGNFRADKNAYNVTVGRGGANASGVSQAPPGEPSAFGDLLKVGGGQGGYKTDPTTFDLAGGSPTRGSTPGGTDPGSGAGGTVYGSTASSGISLTITGKNETYGEGGNTAGAQGYGHGGWWNNTERVQHAAATGVVIVKTRLN